MMVTQLCEYAKNEWLVHFKWVNCMTCKLYLSKAIIFEKKWKRGRRQVRGKCDSGKKSECGDVRTTQLAFADFEDGRKGHLPRNVGAL